MINTMNIIYSLVMVQSGQESLDTYSNINPDWNLTELHKTLHSVMGEMVKSGTTIDLLTVTSSLQKRGDSKYIPEVSKIYSTVDTLDILHSDGHFNTMDFLYKKRRAEMLVNSIQHSLTGETFTLDKYQQTLNGALQELQTNTITKESNRDTLVKVMEAHDRAKVGELNGITLPFNTFSRVVLLEEVDFMVVGARPAMGKTAWAISCACGWAFNHNLKVMIFSLEMSRAQMMRRVMAHQSGVDSNRIKYGELTKVDRSKVEAVYTDRMDNITIIEGSQSVGDIASEITRRKASDGVDIIIVDYLQKIRPTSSRHSLYESVTLASNGLKLISQNMKVPVMALSQLSRDSSKVGKRPSLPDLRQSGEIEQDASVVGFIHRPEYYGEEQMDDGGSSKGVAEIIIGKNREGDTGIYRMRLDLTTSKFMDETFTPQLQEDEVSF